MKNIKSFNEWIADQDKLNGLSHGEQLDTVEDPDLVESQLSQMTDRVFGLLYNIYPEKKSELLEKFIAGLKSRLDENI